MSTLHNQVTLYVPANDTGAMSTGHNIVNTQLELEEEILLALTDNSSSGYMDGDIRLQPLAVAKYFVLPKLEALLSEQAATSARLLLKGEKYITSLKVVTGGTIKNQMTKDMGRVIWNYGFITDSGLLCSLVIATKKNHNHSKRNKNA